MIYLKKTCLLLFLILFSDKVFSQRINNLDFGLEGREVFLNFNITSKYDNREIYNATVYVTEKQSGYDQVSTRSNFRKKLNLSSELVSGIKSGNNSIKFDVSYLNEYLGSDVLFEFEIELIPSFIPVNFNTSQLKIGKENTINLNYWEGYSNLSFSLNSNGQTYLSGNIDKNKSISIPKDFSKGNYTLTVINSGFGGDSYTQEVTIKKGSIFPIVGILLGGGIIYILTSGGSDGGNKGNPPLPEPPMPGG
tara:strand:+ start:43 stop:792 length:750 start_codon:yes stop_codon:yes gene_type:complete